MHHLPDIWDPDGLLVDCGFCNDVLAGPQVEQNGHVLQGNMKNQEYLRFWNDTKLCLRYNCILKVGEPS